MGWADSAADGATGGRGGYGGGATGGGSSGRGGRLGSELGTVGKGHGYGSGHTSTGRGNDNRTVTVSKPSVSQPAPSQKAAPSSSTTSTPSSRADIATQTRTDSRRTGLNEDSARGPLGGVTTGAVASLDERAERSFMDEAAADRQTARGFMDRLDAASSTTAENRARAETAIHEQSKPGLLGTAVQGALSLTGPLGMVAGKVGSTGLAASQAQDTIQDHNVEFGLDIDDSFGRAVGRQALGTVTGTLGGMAGSRVGGDLGMALAGPYGGVVGGLLGGVIGGNTGRGIGLSPSGSAPPGEGMGDGQLGPSGGAMMASSTAPSPSQAETPAPSYGPVDFDGYASYAEQFFS